jgi:hypothetical protein
MQAEGPGRDAKKAAGRSALSRLAWFVGIWLASVLALAAVGGVLRWILAV